MDEDLKSIIIISGPFGAGKNMVAKELVYLLDGLLPIAMTKEYISYFKLGEGIN